MDAMTTKLLRARLQASPLESAKPKRGDGEVEQHWWERA
jgi:hypothetical protein